MHSFIAQFHMLTGPTTYLSLHDLLHSSMVKHTIFASLGFHPISNASNACETVPKGFTMVKLFPSLLSFIQKVEFCLCGAAFNVHETLLKLPLRLVLDLVSMVPPLFHQ
jgi:hypothetical protein